MSNLLSTRRSWLPAFETSSGLRQDMDRLFNQFFGDNMAGGIARGWSASASIWEDDEHVFLEIEVPGVAAGDLDLTVQNGALRISAERKTPEGERNYWHNERVYGRFDRVISLPDVVDPDTIDAEMHNGVLCVKLSKKPEAQPKKVTVKASE